ncbi:hypothetical protein Dimus_002593, partial [Dionaea muscipula]
MEQGMMLGEGGGGVAGDESRRQWCGAAVVSFWWLSSRSPNEGCLRWSTTNGDEDGWAA